MKRKSIIPAVIWLMAFLLFTLSLKFIDVEAIGPQGTMVGYAKLNSAFFNLTGVNERIDKISDILALIAILMGLYFVFKGFLQLLKRKSLTAVDSEIYLLAIFLVLMAATYFLFNIVTINYRPILEDGVLEGSYPSSHVLLAICLCGYVMVMDENRLLTYGALFVLVASTLCRLLSGVHWLTDVIGAILIAGSLIAFFSYFVDRIRYPELYHSDL